MSTWLHRLFGRNGEFEQEPEERLIPEEVFNAVVSKNADQKEAIDPEEDAEDWEPILEVSLPSPDEPIKQNGGDIIIDEAAQIDEAVERAAEIMGTALVRSTMPPRIEMSMALPDYYRRAYHGSMCASMIMGPQEFYGGRASRIAPDMPPLPTSPGYYQYQASRASRFSDKIQKKAWKLLEEYMKPSQYNAFTNGRAVELVNNSESHRLMINMAGHFTILEGTLGDGFVVLQGAIKEREYPLGDEIAAFMDWFRYKTGELINRWNCGNFSIVPDSRKGW